MIVAKTFSCLKSFDGCVFERYLKEFVEFGARSAPILTLSFKQISKTQPSKPKFKTPSSKVATKECESNPTTSSALHAFDLWRRMVATC